jgi:hypothetical protein
MASILLLFCFLLLGSGTLEYIHDLQHDAEDAREDAIARAANLPLQEHHHDENNCPTHAALHMTFTVMAWVPILILLGLFVAFLSLLDTPLVARAIPMRIDCRGPPVHFLFNLVSL